MKYVTSQLLLCMSGLNYRIVSFQCKKPFRVGLVSLRPACSVEKAVERVEEALRKCMEAKVKLACFPEAYIPGLRGAGWKLPPPNQKALENALTRIKALCKRFGVSAIVGMEWVSSLGLENRAFVISSSGRLLGYQTKNQITPGGEEKNYVPNGKRRCFKVQGLKFGIVICHEGWRYPETVRWAVLKGAKVIFQPQVTGDDRGEGSLREWGSSFYEKAMQCRASENTVYFCSVNCAMRNQKSATSVIDPEGRLVAWTPYGKEEVLAVDLDLSLATRFYAKRLKPLPP